MLLPRYNMGMTEPFTTIYNMLWDTSFEAVSRGKIEIDSYITNPETDRRRGLTLIFRPTDELKRDILAFLDQLRRLELDQFYYTEANLHFTVLSLFTATADHQREYDHLDAYQAAVESAIRGISPFTFQLKGLTLSKSAVMLCGFPRPDNLNAIRKTLRKNLIYGGLAQGLDRRYILTAAHTTILRFSAPLKNPARFSEFLLENKQRGFGSLTVDRLQLVKNDWYMSKQNTTLIEEYHLDEQAGQPANRK